MARPTRTSKVIIEKINIIFVIRSHCIMLLLYYIILITTKRPFMGLLILGMPDRIRLFTIVKSLPFLLVRRIENKFSILTHFVVRLNLRFTSYWDYYNINKDPKGSFFILWYARQDLNLRPFAPQANALSS